MPIVISVPNIISGFSFFFQRLAEDLILLDPCTHEEYSSKVNTYVTCIRSVV